MMNNAPSPAAPWTRRGRSAALSVALIFLCYFFQGTALLNTVDITVSATGVEAADDVDVEMDTVLDFPELGIVGQGDGSVVLARQGARFARIVVTGASEASCIWTLGAQSSPRDARRVVACMGDDFVRDVPLSVLADEDNRIQRLCILSQQAHVKHGDSASSCVPAAQYVGNGGVMLTMQFGTVDMQVVVYNERGFAVAISDLARFHVPVVDTSAWTREDFEKKHERDEIKRPFGRAYYGLFSQLIRDLIPRRMSDLVVVEVGVARGGHCFSILSFPDNRIKRLYGIDPYRAFYDEGDFFAERTQLEFDGMHSYVVKRMRKAFGDTFTMIRKPSVEGARSFAEGSIDAIFIDGNHQSEAVVSDLSAWYDRVRDGGLIAGDDFHMESVKKGVAGFIDSLPPTQRPTVKMKSKEGHENYHIFYMIK